MPSADSPVRRVDDIVTLLMSAPPRGVPADVRRAAFRETPPVFLMVFGAVFLAAGLFFVRLFFPWNFYRDAQLAAADTLSVVGRVDSVADTTIQINHRRVVRYEFSFQPPAGPTMRGACFTTGRSWRTGERATVRYRPEDPAICCLAGARMSEGSAGSAFTLIFPAVGSALVLWGVIARRRLMTLLERGRLAEASISAVEATNIRVNNRYVYKITLQRTDTPEGGTFVVRCTQPGVIAFAQERQKTNQLAFVLYDPAKPKRALLPETLVTPAS